MRKYLGFLILGLGLVGGAYAQGSFPNRPIKLVVGAAPGGSNDFLGRALAEQLTHVLGQPVVVENRPGVGSSVGADSVVKAPPDGYTILVAGEGPISVNPELDTRWASAQTLVPVAKLTTAPLVITVNAQLGIKSVRELIEYAKKNPGKLNFAHPGMGTVPHLAGVLFNQQAGTDLVAISFKGGGPAAQSVMAGDTQLMFATPPSVLPQFKAGGRLVGLAVTSTNRFSLVPDLPGMKEAGLPDFTLVFWYGLFVPPGTPAEIVKKLFDATTVAMQKPDFKAALTGGGVEVTPLPSSAEFAAFVREQNKFWGKLAKESGAKIVE